MRHVVPSADPARRTECAHIQGAGPEHVPHQQDAAEQQLAIPGETRDILAVVNRPQRVTQL